MFYLDDADYMFVLWHWHHRSDVEQSKCRDSMTCIIHGIWLHSTAIKPGRRGNHLLWRFCLLYLRSIRRSQADNILVIERWNYILMQICIHSFMQALGTEYLLLVNTNAYSQTICHMNSCFIMSSLFFSTSSESILWGTCFGRARWILSVIGKAPNWYECLW